jgi:hypothetical protein
MCADEEGPESFEELFRQFAREMSRSVERAVGNVDLDEIAGSLGVDPDRAREWVEGASSWLRGRAEEASGGGEFGEPASRPQEPPRHAANRPEEQRRPAASRPEEPRRHAATQAEDPLRRAGPHPLDVPTEEQGLALAALDSCRWTVEPGSDALAVRGEGPGPSDAIGLLRGLRARDWVSVDGTLTLVGRHALGRWLDAHS